MNQNNFTPNSADSSAELAHLQRKKRLFQGLLTVGIILFIVAQFSGMVVLAPVGFVLILVFSLLLSRVNKQMKEAIGAPLVRSALEEVFGQVEYYVHERLPDHLLEVDAMDFPFDIDRIDGSDYVRTTYQGLQIEFSDIELIDRQRSGKSTRNVTKFEGIWMICDFGKPLSADLLVCERTMPSFRFAENLFGSDNEIKTENEDFNEKFLIRSDSEHDAFYILTPHMMEYIQQTDCIGGGDLYLRFMRSGKVHIAVNSGWNSFEMSASEDAETMRNRFVSEIRYITDLIDELRLVDTIFKK